MGLLDEVRIGGQIGTWLLLEEEDAIIPCKVGGIHTLIFCIR
jgi:hypothetical protein